MNPKLNFRGPSPIDAASLDTNQMENVRGMAHQNSNQSTASLAASAPAVQRKLAETDKDDTVMRKEKGAGGNSVSSQFQANISSRKTGGKSLDPNVSGFMSKEFGTDFSSVKVHHDEQANQMAREVNARAFTVGNDIYFDKNEYQPNSKSGKKLLAHELTHVVQQSPNIQRKPNSNGVKISKASQKQVSRWKTSGNEATVTKKGDTLAQLAKNITGNWKDWACIWIKNMKNSTKSWEKGYERWLEIGDTFDITNLKATTGVSATINFTGADNFLTAMQTIYGGTPNSDPFMDQLETLSLQGNTPIHNLTLVGHSGGSQMWGTPGSGFDASTVTPELPRPDGIDANNNSGPPRCWFTRNATIRFVGCSSTNIASTASKTMLRKGAAAVGTNHWICGWNQTAPVVQSMVSVEQPCNWPPTATTYLTPAGFHGAAGVWETHKGKL